MILIEREESRKAVLAVLSVNNEQINRGTQEEKQEKRGKGEALCVYTRSVCACERGTKKNGKEDN